MDREKAVEYFKRLGFASVPSRFSTKCAPNRNLTIQGDALSVGDEVTLSPPDSCKPNKKDVYRPQSARSTMHMEEVHRTTAYMDISSKMTPRVKKMGPDAVTLHTACCCISSTHSRKLNSIHSTYCDPTVMLSSVVSGGENETFGANGDTSSSDEDEDSQLSLDRILNLIEQHGSNPVKLGKCTTSLCRLATCFSLTSSLTEIQTSKIKKFVDVSSQQAVRELGLQVLNTLLAKGHGQWLASHPQVLHNLIHFTNLNGQTDTQMLAFQALDRMLSMREPPSEYEQIKTMLGMEVYPGILQILHSASRLEVKLAACCLLRTLARDPDLAVTINKESSFLLHQLRDSSAVMKEVFAGVLVALYAHPGLTEDVSINISILPVVKELLKTGPCETQKVGLQLVSGILSDGTAVTTVLSDQRFVAYVLACLLTSQCRKVRREACKIAAIMTSTRKTKQARLVLECVGYYMQPFQEIEATVAGGDMAVVTYPSNTKNQSVAVLWHDMDRLLEGLASLVSSEGVLEKENSWLYSELPVKGQVSEVQLQLLASLVQVITNFCCWPLPRRTTVVPTHPILKDLSSLTDNFSLRERCSTFSPQLTVQQWKTFSPRIWALFKWLLQRASAGFTDFVEKSPLTTATLPMDKKITSTEKKESVKKPTDSFQADASVKLGSAGCELFAAEPREDVASRSGATRPSSASLSLKSRSSSCRPPSRPASAKHSVKRSPFSLASSQRLPCVRLKDLLSAGEWVLLRSLLDFLFCAALSTCKQIIDPLIEEEQENDEDETRATKAEQKRGLTLQKSVTAADQNKDPLTPEIKEERELAMVRKALRRELFNEGLFTHLGFLLGFADTELKMVCCPILRLLVQPLNEKNITDSHKHADIVSSHKALSRHEAVCPKSRQSAIKRALITMSPSSASVVREALRPSIISASSVVEIPSQTDVAFLSLTAENKKKAAEDNVGQHGSSSSSREASSSISPQPPPPFPNCCQPNKTIKRATPIMPGQPINKRCQEQAAVECAAQVIRDLFGQSLSVKRNSLLVLHDLVSHSDREVHMELSKLGIIPKLLDFIRVSEDKEQLEIMALKVLRWLVLSDDRFRQLFSHHGGLSMLIALTRCPNFSIQREARAVLAAINRVDRFALPEQHPKQGDRPFSAPVIRGNYKSVCTNIVIQPKDIWDNIMQRWMEEDRVVSMLQQFI